MVKPFNSKTAPPALGPYSHGSIHQGVLYLSGQLGIDPQTGQLAPGGVAAEATQALKNLTNILEEVGADFTQVIQTRLYLLDLADFAVVNSIYAQILGNAKPARTTVQVAGLPLGGLVEIEMTVQLQNYS